LQYNQEHPNLAPSAAEKVVRLLRKQKEISPGKTNCYAVGFIANSNIDNNPAAGFAE